jgi:hypothetical protein
MTNQELRLFVARQEDIWKFSEWLGDRDSRQMWAECRRPDWLLWWASLCLPFREIALAACDCAETALHCVPEGEDRPRLAIETARRWLYGSETLDQYYRARAEALSYAVEARRQAAVDRLDGADAYAGFAAANCGYNLYHVISSAIDADKMNAQKMCDLIRQRWPECPVPEVAA